MSLFSSFSPWIAFSVCFFGVILSGWRLSVQAEDLAAKKGFTKGAVGFVLLGFATSLPELITTLSSVLLLDNPEMGAGNILGSDCANLFILFLSLLTVKTLRNNDRVDMSNLNSMTILFIMLSTLLFGVVLEGAPRFGGLSPYSFIILFCFVLSIVTLGNREEAPARQQISRQSLGALFHVKLVFFLLLIVVLSHELSVSVDRLVAVTGMNNTAAGAVLLAWATSLPEFIVTVTAFIIGSAEMGVGNILGSNIFNLMILSLADILSFRELSVFSGRQSVLLLIALLFVMSSVLVYLLLLKRIKKIFGISPLPVIMILLYIVCIVAVF